MRAARRSRHARLARSLFGLLVAAVIFFAGLEAVLIGAQRWLPTRLNNHALSKYGNFPGGMAIAGTPRSVVFLHSDFSTETYFNGHRWLHRTDRWGFRNPDAWERKSILLLGDSLVYGHGVEQEETFSHYLRNEFGWPVYNMARQGDCLFQQYILVRVYLGRFRPERVLLFAFANDLGDLTVFRTEEELRRRPEIDEYDYDALYEQARRLDQKRIRILSKRNLERLRGVRLLRGIAKDLRSARSAARTRTPGDDPARPAYLEPVLDDATFSLLAEYFRTIVADLASRIAAGGAELHLVDLDVRRRLDEFPEAFARIGGLIEETCRENGLTCFSTLGLFEDCEDCFLPADGHLSPAGNHRLARFVDSVLSGLDGSGS